MAQMRYALLGERYSITLEGHHGETGIRHESDGNSVNERGIAGREWHLIMISKGPVFVGAELLFDYGDVREDDLVDRDG